MRFTRLQTRQVAKGNCPKLIIIQGQMDFLRTFENNILLGLLEKLTKSVRCFFRFSSLYFAQCTRKSTKLVVKCCSKTLFHTITLTVYNIRISSKLLLKAKSSQNWRRLYNKLFIHFGSFLDHFGPHLVKCGVFASIIETSYWVTPLQKRYFFARLAECDLKLPIKLPISCFDLLQLQYLTMLMVVWSKRCHNRSYYVYHSIVQQLSN